MFVASMPLKDKLVDVVRVPLTDGEIFPLPLTPTGESSAETPASLESNPVKLRVEVGSLVTSSPVICRATVAESPCTSGWSLVTSTNTSETPISSVTSTVLVTEASTGASFVIAFLNPSFSKDNAYEPTGNEVTVQRPSSFVTVVRVKLVASFFTVTDAPGTTAPFGSCTVPASDPATCAWAIPFVTKKQNAAISILLTSLKFILSPGKNLKQPSAPLPGLICAPLPVFMCANSNERICDGS